MWTLLKRTWQEFQEDQAGIMGAELAYYTLFSIFPLILAVISLLGYALALGLPLALDAQEYVLATVRANMPGVADIVSNTVEQVRTQRGTIGAMALVWLIISASAIFAQLQRTLNVIFDVEPPKRSLIGNIIARVTNAAMVFGIVFLLLVAMLLDAALKFVVANTTWLPGSATVWMLLTPLVSLAITAALFALMFKVLPQTRLSWREVLPGAIVGAVLWEVGKQILTWYIGRQTYGEVYGPLAGVIALMVWIYYSTQILFLGAELSATYTQMRRAETAPTPASAARTRDSATT